MKKVVLISVLLLAMFVSAEANLSEFGFEGIELNKSSKILCKTVITDLPIKEELGGILTVKADFFGAQSDNSYVSVKVNNKEKQILWPESFNCEKVCKTRVFVPELKEGKTSFEFCLRTGGNTSSAKLYSSSKVGFYDTPVLDIENTAPEKIFLGERAKMKIIISNTGSKDANVFVQFIADDLRTLLDITSFDIVDGNTKARLNLESDSEEEFVYYIKPSLVSSYNLPSAVLHFTNIFGEKQKIYSEHPQLEVVTPNQIDVILIGKSLEDNKFEFKVKVKNNWDKPFNGELVIEPNDLIGNERIDLNLKSFEQKEINFSTIELRQGSYSVLAKVIDSNNEFFSESSSFVVKKLNYFFEIIFSIIAILVSLGIFAKIYFF